MKKETQQIREAAAVGPAVVADIGGTNARFGLWNDGRVQHVHRYLCADFDSVAAVYATYLRDIEIAAPRRAALAIATPVTADIVRMTNCPWEFSIEGLQRALGLDDLKVVNDLAALAHAVPYLAASSVESVGTLREPKAGRSFAVIGAGTGLGVASAVHDGNEWRVHASEGGHSSFAPTSEIEDVVLRHANNVWAHVSYERLACGEGISVIHRALGAHRDHEPAEIVCLAEQGNGHAIESLRTYSRILGNFAGNVALMFAATMGVYLGGGVLGKLRHSFDADAFREGFVGKGRFTAWLNEIPTLRILAAYPELDGLGHLLETSGLRGSTRTSAP
ncbi:glucokinase [Paraburkholderia metrosideri]|uniref:Glucokinase n=1 Tax=Paraburkholderia metrosideri TaxID=580937 RepID=A0ABM8NTT9_9BURK|nr:glucokinase [Paraburkholderia metrosideri]CAD6543160.1 Glucokinase [Paraburkholderia metrosideri]